MRLPVSTAALLTLALLFSHPGASRSNAAELRWWKGNLHTHTLWSDGDDYPELVAEWYQTNGYHFLAISDHNILLKGEKWIDASENKGGEAGFQRYLERFGADWVETRKREGRREVRLKTLDEFRGKFEAPGRFLMIPGEEITDRYKTAPVHINATNLRDYIPPQGGESVVEVMQNNVDAVLNQRRETGRPMFPHLNHPNFGWGITAEELMRVQGEQFFEVYNGHPAVHNEGDDLHASTERMWDIILTWRIAVLDMEPMFGIAVDDAHNYHGMASNRSNPGRGWVSVRATELTPDAIVHAMEAGDFYSSSGVTLNAIRREDDRLSIDIKPQPGVTYRTLFIGTRRDFDRENEPIRTTGGEALRVTHRYSDDVGAVLAEVEGATPQYRIRGNELYVRAKVISSKLKENPYRDGEFEQAWTQPWIITSE